jgi:hypothetical protein
MSGSMMIIANDTRSRLSWINSFTRTAQVLLKKLLRIRRGACAGNM